MNFEKFACFFITLILIAGTVLSVGTSDKGFLLPTGGVSVGLGAITVTSDASYFNFESEYGDCTGTSFCPTGSFIESGQAQTIATFPTDSDTVYVTQSYAEANTQIECGVGDYFGAKHTYFVGGNSYMNPFVGRVWSSNSGTGVDLYTPAVPGFCPFQPYFSDAYGRFAACGGVEGYTVGSGSWGNLGNGAYTANVDIWAWVEHGKIASSSFNSYGANPVSWTGAVIDGSGTNSYSSTAGLASDTTFIGDLPPVAIVETSNNGINWTYNTVVAPTCGGIQHYRDYIGGGYLVESFSTANRTEYLCDGAPNPKIVNDSGSDNSRYLSIPNVTIPGRHIEVFNAPYGVYSWNYPDLYPRTTSATIASRNTTLSNLLGSYQYVRVRTYVPQEASAAQKLSQFSGWVGPSPLSTINLQDWASGVYVNFALDSACNVDLESGVDNPITENEYSLSCTVVGTPSPGTFTNGESEITWRTILTKNGAAPVVNNYTFEWTGSEGLDQTGAGLDQITYTYTIPQQQFANVIVKGLDGSTTLCDSTIDLIDEDPIGCYGTPSSALIEDTGTDVYWNAVVKDYDDLSQLTFSWSGDGPFASTGGDCPNCTVKSTYNTKGQKNAALTVTYPDSSTKTANCGATLRDFDLTCSVSPADPEINDTVTWTATAIASGTPTYSWSGDATGNTAVVTETYATTGTKTATVTATVGGDTETATCSVDVTGPVTAPSCTLTATPSGNDASVTLNWSNYSGSIIPANMASRISCGDGATRTSLTCGAGSCTFTCEDYSLNGTIIATLPDDATTCNTTINAGESCTLAATGTTANSADMQVNFYNYSGTLDISKIDCDTGTPANLVCAPDPATGTGVCTFTCNSLTNNPPTVLVTLDTATCSEAVSLDNSTCNLTCAPQGTTAILRLETAETATISDVTCGEVGVSPTEFVKSTALANTYYYTCDGYTTGTTANATATPGAESCAVDCSIPSTWVAGNYTCTVTSPADTIFGFPMAVSGDPVTFEAELYKDGILVNNPSAELSNSELAFGDGDTISAGYSGTKITGTHAYSNATPVPENHTATYTLTTLGNDTVTCSKDIQIWPDAIAQCTITPNTTTLNDITSSKTFNLAIINDDATGATISCTDVPNTTADLTQNCSTLGDITTCTITCGNYSGTGVEELDNIPHEVSFTKGGTVCTATLTTYDGTICQDCPQSPTNNYARVILTPNPKEEEVYNRNLGQDLDFKLRVWDLDQDGGNGTDSVTVKILRAEALKGTPQYITVTQNGVSKSQLTFDLTTNNYATTIIVDPNAPNLDTGLYTYYAEITNITHDGTAGSIDPAKKDNLSSTTIQIKEIKTAVPETNPLLIILIVLAVLVIVKKT